MLDDPEAEHDIEGFSGERQLHDVRLSNSVARTNREIPRVRVHRRAQIDRRHVGAFGHQDLREPARAASALENLLAGERAPQRFAEAASHAITCDRLARVRIELRFWEAGPLRPETAHAR